MPFGANPALRMKLLAMRFLLVWMCLLVPAVGFAGLSGSSLEVFEINNRKGLKDHLGNVLIPAKYEEIGWSNKSMEPLESTIGYKQNGFWGLTSLSDEQITKAIYRDFYPLANKLIKASRSNSLTHFPYYGILDTKGRARIGFQYYDIEVSGQGYIASTYINQQTLYGLISSSEKVIIPFAYKEVAYIGSGLYKAIDEKEKIAVYTAGGLKLPNEGFDSVERAGGGLLVVSREGKLGLMRNDGSFVLEPFYKKLEVKNDSTFELTSYPQWHLIDQGNSVLKTFHYDDLEPISAGVYRARTYEGDALINMSGKQLSNKSNWQITYADQDFVISREKGKYNVYNQAGELLLEGPCDSIHYDGAYFYTLNRKSKGPQWEIYNTYGRKISRFPYQEVKPVGSKLIPARKDGYWGFLDFNGSLAVDHKFENVQSFREGMAAVEYLGSWGVIDLYGNWILSPRYLACEVLNKDVILTRLADRVDLLSPENKWLYSSNHQIGVRENWLIESTSYGSYGLLTAGAQKVVSSEFDDLVVPDNDSLVFLKQNDYWWVIDKKGRVIGSPADRYQHVFSLSEAYFGIVKDDKFGFADLNNKLRIANRYEEAQPFSDSRAAVKLMGRWGFIDKGERLVIQPVYDEVTSFAGGISIVQRNGKFGLISKTGEEVAQLSFDSIHYAGKNIYILRQGNQAGTYHTKTGYLMPPRFNQLSILPNGLLISEKRGHKGLINEKGVDLIPSVYQEIIYDPFKDLYLCMEPGKTETFRIR